MPRLVPGFRFTHRTLLDLSWTPGPGQKYADAPKAACTVTRVTAGMVWYGYTKAGRSVGGFCSDRAAFERNYLEGAQA
jgi:hypothetical protein